MNARLLAALLCTACAEETILAAHDDRTRDAGDDSNDDDDGAADGERCRSNDECDAQDFCDKDSCDAEYGTCVPTDGECAANAPPVCGCDGMTYFNDCIRRQHGASIASREPCRDSARTCGGSDRTPCDAPAYCARMSTPMSMMDGVCDPAALGQCWIMPARCNSEPHEGEGHYLCHEGPGGGGPGGGPDECLDLCNAIISGRPFVRVWDCDRDWSPP
jgi:hypothetical protein